jgi:hypothetical protein
MDEKHTDNTASCRRSVMSRIECGEICPRSRTFFKTRECVVWALWFVSVIVGALAVAVTLFVVAHRQYALFEATHDSFFMFLVEVLPFVWILVFGLMIGVGVYNLRHTKRGYRYPMWQIIGSSMVLSLAGGAGLHFVGVGYMTDHMLGQKMGTYDSQEKIEAKLWQNAQEGRLVGFQKAPMTPPGTTITFTDIEGAEWEMSVVDLHQYEIDLLDTKQKVKVMGVIKHMQSGQFHLCGVFPWEYGNSMNRDDLHEVRESFRKKMHDFEDRAERRLEMMSIDDDSIKGESVCADLRPLKRKER